jgi:hypothetical protein
VPEELLDIEAIDSLERPVPGSDALLGAQVADPAAERRVRQELRRQIALLEKRLGELFASAFPRAGIDWGVPAVGGPRVLGVAELERVRDGLAVRLREAQAELGRRGEVEEANRGLLESMIAEPDRYRWVRVSAEDVGERPCQHWHSRPRWGILGMLLGWWRVKHSSGCPLAAGLAAPGTCKSMSKKRRKRRPRKRPPVQRSEGEATGDVAASPAKPAARRRPRSSLDERPPAPWGSFPLVELAVLAGIALLVAGFVVQGSQGVTMIAAGAVLCSIAGLELSIREHFAGYRSHTFLLSGAAAVAVLAGLYFLVPALWLPIALAIALGVFAITAVALTRAFQRRSGRAFKLR